MSMRLDDMTPAEAFETLEWIKDLEVSDRTVGCWGKYPDMSAPEIMEMALDVLRQKLKELQH